MTGKLNKLGLLNLKITAENYLCYKSSYFYRSFQKTICFQTFNANNYSLQAAWLY